MVISSIDLKDSHVVQLQNGCDLKLSRDDATDLIKHFDMFGNVAIIDLDQAMRNCDSHGNTKNTELLKSLLRKGSVRVGGGIRTVEKARYLVSQGAQKVIIGSAAFLEKPEGDNILNTSFLCDLIKAIGKQRIIISVDAIKEKIAVKGWKETNGVDLLTAAKLACNYASELLFTCVEKEGCLMGADLPLIKKVRDTIQENTKEGACKLVAAGGISTIEEVVQLEKWGVDCQVGMSLYTGAIKLEDAFIACLNWEKSPLIPIIAQSTNDEVLMLGFANKEALKKTFETGHLTFFSRTRNTLWTKGETSGHFLQVIKVRADCDRDTILATVLPCGNVCHTGSWTCFSQEKDEKSSLYRLYNIIAERFKNPTPSSYTATLDYKRVREKVTEEAQELCEAQDKNEVIWEAADLLYFVTVLVQKAGVCYEDIYNELDRRHKE